MTLNGNQAKDGGAMCNHGSSPNIVNATITNNTGLRAPGIYNSNSSPSIANSLIHSNDNFEFALLCKILQFPCGVSDVPEDVLLVDDIVTEEAKTVLESGTMDDVLTFLNNNENVVQVLTSQYGVGWRVAGGAPSILIDGSEMNINIPGFGKTSYETLKSAAALDYPDATAHSLTTTRRMIPDRSIIGSDWNNDGQVNSRDGKRALILSPFGFADADDARRILAATPGYEGFSTRYVGVFEMLDDSLMTDWTTWDSYDFVYASVVSDILSFPTTTSSFESAVIITTNGSAENNLDFPGLFEGNIYVSGAGVQPVTMLTPQFFDFFYGGNLRNNGVFHCSYCQPLNSNAWESSFSTTGDFALHSWSLTASRDFDELAILNNRALDSMAVGLNSPRIQGDEGFYQYRFTDPKRIMELPVLRYDPAESDLSSASHLIDLTDITAMIQGVVDDNVPDKLFVNALVYGIASSAALNDIELRIVVGSAEISIDPSLLVESDFSEHVYELTAILDLDFPIESGLLLLELTVDLPDGTESAYSVLASVNAFSCDASSTFSGYRNGAFTGPAVWNGNSSTASLTVESTTSILGFGPEPDLLGGPSDFSVQLSMSNPVIDTVDTNRPTYYAVDYAVQNIRYTAELGWFSYLPDSYQCPDCDAWVRVDSVIVDSIFSPGPPPDTTLIPNIYGEYYFEGWDVTFTNDDPRISSASGRFPWSSWKSDKRDNAILAVRQSILGSIRECDRRLG